MSMKKYAVDVKAFVTVVIEAENEKEARKAAEGYVEARSPTPEDVAEFRDQSIEDDQPTALVACSEFSIDGASDVEEIDGD